MNYDTQTGGAWDSEFRRSVWKGLAPMALGLIVAVLAIRGESMAMSGFAAVAFLGGSWELFLAIRDPLLVITPGTITYHGGRFGSAIEMPKHDIESWTVRGNVLIIDRKNNKPINIKLSVLRKRDKSRIASVLISFGYPRAERRSIAAG